MAACRTHPDCPSFTALLFPISSVVDADGISLDVGVKSVFVELDSTSGEWVMQNIREALVMKVFDSFLQCVLQWALASSWGSRIPAQNANTSLLKKTVWHTVVEPVFWLRRKMSSFVRLAEDVRRTSLLAKGVETWWIGHHPSCVCI